MAAAKRRRRKRNNKKKQKRGRRRNHRGGAFDIQKMLSKTGMEFHWPGYQYMGPGTHLKKRLARGDPGINRLDRIAKQHDIDYSQSKNLQDKHVADHKMINKIKTLPGKKTSTEKVVQKIMETKLKLNL